VGFVKLGVDDGGGWRSGWRMSEAKDKPAAKAPAEGPGPTKDDREARLAAALRANLRRRKAAND
jgi:hypothetical protein